MGFGIGLGSFVDGFGKGIGIGRQLKESRRQDKIDSAYSDSMDAAKQDYDGQLAKSIIPTSQLGPDGKPLMDANGKALPAWKVGDQTFTNQDKARKAADAEIGGIANVWRKGYLPKVMQAYIQNGAIDKASALQSYADGHDAQAHKIAYAGLVRGLARGDFGSAERNFKQLYNDDNYYPDGQSFEGFHKLTDKDGNVIGINANFKNKSTGEIAQQTFNNMDDLTRTAINYMDPVTAWQYRLSQMDTTDKAKIEFAKSGREFQNKVDLSNLGYEQNVALKNLDFKQNVAMGDRQFEQKDTLADRDAKRRAQENEQKSGLDMERDSNKSLPDQARDAAKAKGPDAVKDLTKRINGAMTTLANNDQNFLKLNDDEKAAKAMGFIKAQDDAVAKAAPGGYGLPPATGASSGKPIPLWPGPQDLNSAPRQSHPTPRGVMPY